MTRSAIAVLLVATALAGTPARAEGQVRSVRLAGTTLNVFTYRPAGCRLRLLLLVFHGADRDAGQYRDDAEPIANAACGFVVAPKFDRRRFPRALYQYGGVAGAGPRTVDLVQPLVAWARSTAGENALPVVLIGHSAGAQFLGRVAAFTPSSAACIVIANPSTWVSPDTTTPAPFGFGGAEHAADLLRGYLARPIVVLLGADDTTDHELATSPEAMAQGPNRLARGLRTFGLARTAAARHGWTFGWTLIEVPGVGHDARAMLASPQALRAVGCQGHWPAPARPP